MSSTKRGSSRTAADDYPTPHWCVHRLLDAVDLPTQRADGPAHWLEPTAGEGAIVEACNTWFSDRSVERPEWTACDLRGSSIVPLDDKIRRGGRGVVIGDFRRMDFPGREGDRFDVSITNPPYYCVDDILGSAFKLSRIVVMLLRLNYVGSKARGDFMRKHAPDIYSIPNRPRFSGTGTDSIEYAWFVWDVLHPQRTGRFCVLDDTPIEIRRAEARAMREREVGRYGKPYRLRSPLPPPPPSER